jgi:hypothetical protein
MTLAARRRAIDWPALALLLLGAAVRTYALGHDALWFDEVGQLLAATQPTLGGMVAAIRHHAMALPGDYVVTRLAALLTPNLAHAELVLRVPALVWGVLSLAACYALARRAVPRPAAWVALALLVLWSLHVRYSQELRFYAALTFFSFAATAAVWRALRRPRAARRWLLALALAALGSYFHPYVLLVFVTGGALLLACPPAPAERRAAWLGLIGTALAAGLAFAPGYLAFGARQQFDYDLWEFGGSFVSVMAQGLGWTALGYANATPRFGLYETLLFGGTLLGGLVALVQPRRHAALLALAVAAGAQVLLIFAADVVRGYWFLSRQLLAAAPLLFPLAGLGLVAAAQAVGRALARPAAGRLALAGLVGLLTVGAAVDLSWYYAYPRTTTGDIAALLAAHHQPGQPVYIISPSELELYRFQLSRQAGGAAVRPDLHPLTWDELPALPAASGPTYLAFSARPTAAHLALVSALGFTPLLDWGDNWLGAQSLYVRVN